MTRPRARLLVLGGTVDVEGLGAVEIVRRDGTADRPILRLAGVDGREAIEALRGAELRVSRDALPPLEEDEWYAEDLEGLAVVDGEREVGRVVRMLGYPSCELLEVERAGADALLVPLISDAVREVDLATGRVDVDLTFLGEE